MVYQIIYFTKCCQSVHVRVCACAHTWMNSYVMFGEKTGKEGKRRKEIPVSLNVGSLCGESRDGIQAFLLQGRPTCEGSLDETTTPVVLFPGI